MHNYFTNLYEIECVSQHYHRTLENISIWDIIVWDSMEFFDPLNLTAIPREMNSKADALAIATSTLQLSEDLVKKDTKMEIIFNPSIPNNVDY